MSNGTTKDSAVLHKRGLRLHLNPFLQENGKLIAQFIFTLFFFAIGIWFLKHESVELGDVKHTLSLSRWQWVTGGIVLTLVYIVLQGQMYVWSFASVGSRISLIDATTLFIKRNLISVFLPAGGISSLAFFSGPVEQKGVNKSQIHFASSIYGFTGILTVVIVAIPVLIYSFIKGSIGADAYFGLGALIILLAGLVLLFRSIMRKGAMYGLFLRLLPGSEVILNEIIDNSLERRKVMLTILISLVIEAVGIAHLYIAMAAMNFDPSFYTACLGYVVSVIFLIVSPFLRGLGAIEVSMTYVLVRLGFQHVEAISITLLYRFFEFWLPLLGGILTFLAKVNKLLMRMLPAIFIMLLGVMNIVSVLTPAIPARLELIKEFLPIELINASNYLVIAAGMFLMVTAAFMLKGLRTAWWFALILSGLSLLGHIGKAIDYEEAIVALLVIVVLIVTHREYYVRSNPRLRLVGIRTALLLTVAVIIYGTVGFYFLDKKYFDIDFNIFQSVRYTLQNYLLIGSSELVATEPFARHFLYSLNVSGFVSMSFLIFTLVRPYVIHNEVTRDEFSMAGELVDTFGKSPLDYFKTYTDKLFFFTESRNAFLAYRISGNFAVVLENPVAGNEKEFRECLLQADDYFLQNGLKSIYYRVPEKDLSVYRELNKKQILIGQEGRVDVSQFSLEGSEHHSIRNALKKVVKEGYTVRVHTPPVMDGILQKVKSVSDEWLRDTGRKEIIFSQGMFLWEDLKQQTLLTVENVEERIVGFLNMIPDYRAGEATYDLIRKTRDAPNGVMDFMLVELLNYAKSQGHNYINLGFAPLSGLDEAKSFPERSMKFAYGKIKTFAHYRGLRTYKEKFVTEWENQYLVYQNDYDLLQVPAVLARVFRA